MNNFLAYEKHEYSSFFAFMDFDTRFRDTPCQCDSKEVF